MIKPASPILAADADTIDVGIQSISRAPEAYAKIRVRLRLIHFGRAMRAVISLSSRDPGI